MAYTVSILDKTVFGNKVVRALQITADAATQTVVTGLNTVDYYTLAPVSMTSSGIKIFKNAGAIGTSIAGALGVSGVTSGDVFIVLAYGR